jgi:environmental stress-induced protein Ves
MLVMMNSVYETRRPPARSLARGRTLHESASLVLQDPWHVHGDLYLWSFWTAESVSDWLLMIRGAACTAAVAALAVRPGRYRRLLGLALLTYAVWKGNWTR